MEFFQVESEKKKWRRNGISWREWNVVGWVPRKTHKLIVSFYITAKASFFPLLRWLCRLGYYQEISLFKQPKVVFIFSPSPLRSRRCRRNWITIRESFPWIFLFHFYRFHFRLQKAFERFKGARYVYWRLKGKKALRCSYNERKIKYSSRGFLSSPSSEPPWKDINFCVLFAFPSPLLSLWVWWWWKI